MKGMNSPGVILKQEEVGHICRPVFGGRGRSLGLQGSQERQVTTEHQPVSREL